MRVVTLLFLTATLSVAQSPELRSPDGKFLGNLNLNPLDPNSVANPLGRYGSPLSPDSINNPLGRYGSPISPLGVNNPLATEAPLIFSRDGKYLGRLSSNPLDPDSVSNPVGRFGSPVSPDSISNPVGRYGSPVSPESVNNPLGRGAGEHVGPAKGSYSTPWSPRLGTPPAWWPAPPASSAPGKPLFPAGAPKPVFPSIPALPKPWTLPPLK